MLECVEWRDTVSSVWAESGLARWSRALLRRESDGSSRVLLATKEAGREWPGVVFLLEIRLSSGLGLAGVAGGGLGSNAAELELATLHGLSLLLSGERWSRCSSIRSLSLLRLMPKLPMLALLRCRKLVPFCGGRSIESMLSWPCVPRALAGSGDGKLPSASMKGGRSSAAEPAFEPFEDGEMDLIPTMMIGTIRPSALFCDCAFASSC